VPSPASLRLRATKIQNVVAAALNDAPTRIADDYNAVRHEQIRLSGLDIRDVLKSLQHQERSREFILSLLDEFARDDPTAFAMTLLMSLIHARSRRIGAMRCWALMCSLPAGEKLVALNECPYLGVRSFGAGLIKILTDPQTSAETRVISVDGPRGIALIEMTDGRAAKFSPSLTS